MIVLGIDPGSRHTGYGVIRVEGRREELVEYGVLTLDGHSGHQARLKQIHDRIIQVIDRTGPETCAIEMPIYGKNPQSMLKLGRAQAAAMLAVLNRQLPVTEYTPKEVKKSVTGNGNAAKEQVWYMVRSILGISDEDAVLGLDASDALGAALCHAHRLSFGVERPFKDWSSFARTHPDRVKP
jgi:crossover junction endodeoxyribonuclease RuvC